MIATPSSHQNVTSEALGAALTPRRAKCGLALVLIATVLLGVVSAFFGTHSDPTQSGASLSVRESSGTSGLFVDGE